MGEDYFKILKHLDIRVREAYLNAFLMWQNRNESVYQFLQQFLELLIKEVVDYLQKSKNLEEKVGLGKMLDNRVVLAIFEYDLKLTKQQISEISSINYYGNQLKHTKNRISNTNEKIIEDFKLCYEIADSFLFNLLSITNEPFKKEWFIRADESVFEKDVEVVNHSLLEGLSKITADRLKELEKENEALLFKNSELAKNDERNRILEKNYVDLKIEFAQKTTELELLEKKFKDNPNDSTTIDELELISTELEEAEDQIKSIRFVDNSSDIIINQNQAIINQNNSEIQRLVNNYGNVDNIIEDSSDTYEAYSNILQHYRVSFDSNYDESQFSITSLNDTDSCKSSYASFYAVIFNQLVRGKKINLSKFLKAQNLQNYENSLVYKLEVAVLMFVRNGLLSDEEWKINLINKSDKYLNLAIRDLFYRVDLLLKLTNEAANFPKIRLSSKDFIEDGLNISFEVLYPRMDNVFSIINDYSNDNLSNLWIEEKIKYSIEYNSIHINILNELLFDFFNFKEFRLGQIDILINTLNGKNTIGILTTSGGKSLIYQFAALMQPKLTIIVDPIIALINDQYRKLTKEFGINRCIRLVKQVQNDEEVSAKKMVETLFTRPSIYNFSTPERFQNQEFREWLIAQSIRKKIGLIVLDEVHCLSEWGHDFRISYLMLSSTINTYCSNFQYLGLTATAAINVIKDLQVELSIYEKENIVFSRKLQRENLDFNIFEFKNFDQMNTALKTTLVDDYQNEKRTFKLRDQEPNGVIVFFKTKKNLRETATTYYQIFKDEITEFHGDEKSTQDDFIENRKNLLFATKAFGMGIDKPNVRKTIHFGMPASREAFFQEAGRAGRDGDKSACLLFTFEADGITKPYVDKFLDLNTSVNELTEVKEKIGYYDKNDLSTIAYFMTQDLDTPQNEAANASRFLKKIISESTNLIYRFTLVNDRNDRKDWQKYYEGLLYILHKVGVVRTWTLNFTGFQKVEITVYLHPDFDDFDHIKTSAINYLNQYSPNPLIVNKISTINNNNIEEIIVVVREWYQNTFLRTKREQLANMFDFIARYKNKYKNVEIQNEMSQFFDISRLLERRDSKLSLTFDNVKLTDVIKRSAKVKNDDLNEIRVNMERLLETEESNKINIFTALVNLRLNNFETRNGKERLILGLKNSTEDEVTQFYKSIKPIYDKCADVNKEELLEVLYEYDLIKFRNYIIEQFEDEITSKLLIKDINYRFKDLF